MAHPLPPGLTPPEVSFLCEMELVTVVPRGRLDSIPLLSGDTPTLRPPHRAQLPLWLALLLKKQRRANIVAPTWLHPSSLMEVIRQETRDDPHAFSKPPPPPLRADGRGFAHRVDGLDSFSRASSLSAYTRGGRGGIGGSVGSVAGDVDGDMILSPPFLPSCVAEAPPGYLPYHWLEMSEMLLAHAADDMPASAGEIRGLLRDLVEVRSAKMRSSTTQLETFGGGVMNLRGVGAMELAENRGFVLGVVDGVRKLGASAEATRREEEDEEGDEDDSGADGGAGMESDEDMGM